MIRKTRKLFVIMITICIMIVNNLTALAVDADEIKSGEITPINESISSEYINIAELQELTNEIEESFETVNSNNMEREYQGEQTKILKSITKSRATSYASYDNTDPNYAYLVANDNVIQGAIETNYQERWYAFELNEKNKATIWLQMATGLDADLYLFKLDTSTYQLSLIGGSANAGSNDEYYMDTLESGIYYFAVAGYSGTGSFAFGFYQSNRDVNYEVNDLLSYASDVPLSTNIVGVIDNPNDIDYYKFTVTKTTLLKYTMSNTSDYNVAYVEKSGTSAAAYAVDGNIIKVMPGTYYFVVYSPNNKYSSNATYTAQFKSIAEISNDSDSYYMAVSEQSGIVFQADAYGQNCYVNGNPIDFNYSYVKSLSNSAGSQNYNITLTPRNDLRVTMYQSQFVNNPELQQMIPNVAQYHSSTLTSYSGAVLTLSLYSTEHPIYSIHNVCSGAYSSNSLWTDLKYVNVFINPNTGKVIDIEWFNYFYEVGSHSVLYYRPYSIKYYYPYWDGSNPVGGDAQ